MDVGSLMPFLGCFGEREKIVMEFYERASMFVSTQLTFVQDQGSRDW